MARASPEMEFLKRLMGAVDRALDDPKATPAEKAKLIEQGGNLLQVHMELRGQVKGKKGMFDGHGD